jgi:hypothetical protein
MVGQALVGIKTADGKQNFKTYLQFVNFKISQRYIAIIIGVAYNSMQFALKDIWLPFAIALKSIAYPFASCRKVCDYYMQLFFWILHEVSNPFLQAAKGN